MRNKFSSKRTKHHVFRDAVDVGKVSVIDVETRNQHADELTKALQKNSF